MCFYSICKQVQAYLCIHAISPDPVLFAQAKGLQVEANRKFAAKELDMWP